MKNKAGPYFAVDAYPCLTLFQDAPCRAPPSPKLQLRDAQLLVYTQFPGTLEATWVWHALAMTSTSCLVRDGIDCDDTSLDGMVIG